MPQINWIKKMQKVLLKNKIVLINIIAYISILIRYIITFLMVK